MAKTKIEIYEGLLKPLVDSKGLLSSTKQGGIQFDLNIPTDGILSIVQMPSAKFLKVDEVDPPSISVWRTLSEEQRRALLDLLPKPDQK